MKLDYRRDIHTRYMIISPDEGGAEASYRLKMITSNEIPGFVHCTCEFMNGVPALYYDVSALQPLSFVFRENKADTAFFRDLINALLSASGTVREYLLDAEDILLTKDTIFMNAKTKEICFICFPFEKKNVDAQLKELAAFLLSKASEEAESIKTAYRFYAACTETCVNADTLMEILRQIREAVPEDHMEMCGIGEAMPEDHDEMRGIPGNERRDDQTGNEFTAREPAETGFGWQKEDDFEIYDKKSRRKLEKGRKHNKTREREKPRKSLGGFLKKRKKPKKSADTDGWEEYKRPVEDLFIPPESTYGKELSDGHRAGTDQYGAYETGKDFFAGIGQGQGVLSGPDPGETVVLSDYGNGSGCGTSAWLVPEDIFFGETIELTEDSYVIGRGRGSRIIDLGVKSASRRHAALTRRGGTYEISDLGSKNGTYVNDDRLGPGERRLLKDGDGIRFADAGYRFCREKTLQCTSIL